MAWAGRCQVADTSCTRPASRCAQARSSQRHQFINGRGIDTGGLACANGGQALAVGSEGDTVDRTDMAGQGEQLFAQPQAKTKKAAGFIIWLSGFSTVEDGLGLSSQVDTAVYRWQ